MNALFAVLLLLASGTASTRAASAWDGTWELDRAKSHLTGQTITLSKAGKDKWRYNDGTISYVFALDGKPVKTFGDGTMSATGDGEHTIDLVFKSMGSESRAHMVLSSDGKTITDQSSGTRPDGSKAEGSGEMKRVGKGTGFAGTWKSTKNESSSGERFGLTIDGAHIKWEWPAYKRMVEGTMDGSPLRMSGATASRDMAFAVRKRSATKLTYTVRGQGKTLAEGMLELSADGKTLTDTEWASAKPKEKSIAVYTK